MTYTIGEAALMTGLNAPTLRYYDREGLLPFVDRSDGGIRLFRESDFDWLRLIECLKATGMPIKDIKQFIDWYVQGDETLSERREMFHERRRAVQAQIEALRHTLETIDYKCWYYDTAAEMGSEQAVKELPPEEIPENIRALMQRIVE